MRPQAEIHEMVSAGLTHAWISEHSGVTENEIGRIDSGRLPDPGLSDAEKIHELYLTFTEIREALE